MPNSWNTIAVLFAGMVSFIGLVKGVLPVEVFYAVIGVFSTWTILYNTVFHDEDVLFSMVTSGLAGQLQLLGITSILAGTVIQGILAFASLRGVNPLSGLAVIAGGFVLFFGTAIIEEYGRFPNVITYYDTEEE